MKHVVDKNFFPGFTRKALTFTIDDGDVINDKKFIDIVRPMGIRGTFNICDVTAISPEEYRELYRGFEIANHVYLHPRVFLIGENPPLCDKILDTSDADPKLFYRCSAHGGVWYFHGSYYVPDVYDNKPTAWFRITDPETYVELMRESHRRIESVFGEGSVKSFVWPFGRQEDCERILQGVGELGYNSARDAGKVPANPDFSMPSDRMNWKYCATQSTLLDNMKAFEALPDDGELKLFAFGVHSIDYEKCDRWGDLAQFAELYGKRPDDFYYSTVSEAFEYEDAIAACIVTDSKIINDSDKTLYIKIDGVPITLQAGSVIGI